MVKFGENSAKFGQIWENLRNFGKKQQKNSAIFNENFEIRERCKGVHCVDLGESFPTSIYLQNLASIQPRTILFVACRRRARGSLLAAGICTSTNYAQSVPLLPRPVGFYP